MIDAGADLVAGHGPHLLRGMELYKGKPIFYSLGNFIGQNELVPKIPADGYERFRADPDLKPGQVYQQRTNNDQARLPRRPPLLGVGRAGADLGGRRTLRGIELIADQPRLEGRPPPRGRPRLAEGGRERHPRPLRRAVEAVRHRVLQRGALGPAGLGASNPVTMVAKQREGAVRSLPVLCTAEAGRPV